MGDREHKELSSKIRARVAVLCITDSRMPDTDESGKIVKGVLERKGHLVSEHLLIKNDMNAISNAVQDLIQRQDIDAVVTIGGTGLSKKDLTIEVVSKLIEKRLEGFGELFRSLSYDQIGSSAMMSRALAGIAKGKIVMSIPGSPSAVKLAARELIAPELSHMIFEVSK